ncbi:MAG: aminoacyl-tRNA hydrolase [Deltaproteobacteria bacterium]|nr:aminoacyl-tRNA hydrolase [Deltaproteobacteria bacterium]
MILLYALQNSQKKYHNSRHNAGSIILSCIVSNSHIKEVQDFEEAKLILIERNNTLAFCGFSKGYMNNSGNGLAQIIQHYHLQITPKNICVFHDDMDLDLGRVKLTFNGGSGGHNGIRSVINALSTADFWRMKIGISKPSLKDYRSQWLLEIFSADEFEKLKLVQQMVLNQCDRLLIGEFKNAQNFLNAFKSG